MTSDSDYALACKAFDLFTLAEKERALERFAFLRFASIRDRWFDAIHWVIKERSATLQGKDAPK